MLLNIEMQFLTARYRYTFLLHKQSHHNHALNKFKFVSLMFGGPKLWQIKIFFR